MGVDQLSNRVAVSVMVQKEGGALGRPKVATRGSAIGGASPGEVGSGNTGKGSAKSRERSSLQNPSERLCSAMWTGPHIGLADSSACSGSGIVFPNCMASGGAMGAVSWLTSKNMQLQMTRGHRLCCGTTPDGLNLSLLWCSDSDAGALSRNVS